jgi:hypothetical protein
MTVDDGKRHLAAKDGDDTAVYAGLSRGSSTLD